MTHFVAWAVRNSPSMNTLMVAVIVVGAAALMSLQRERFPDFRPDEITISVDYPRASPTETEQSICLKVEEAIRSIVGVRKITSVAEEGRGKVTAELQAEITDPHRVLNEIRSAVDRIASFPEEIEEPDVRLAVRLRNVVSVGIVGPVGKGPEIEWQLRQIAESVREELLLLPAISHVDLWHAKPYQIDVELSEAALRKYNLTLTDVNDAIRTGNIEVPAGDIRTRQADLLLRISNKQLTASGIAKIPVLTHPGGLVLTVGDLGEVHDGFADVEIFAELNGRPAMSMELERADSDDMLDIYQQAVEYVANKQLPPGFDFILWNDYSRQARDRIELLSRNAISGLLLVFVVLALFLDLRLAFWVAAGIPVSVLGTCIVMAACGATLNMHSMFAFVMGLGIVVDDAIVIAENVYRHRQAGRSAVRAAIDGTAEVAPSVISSVLTTVVAFIPLTLVSGEMGKWIAVIPLSVVSMLLISLLEGLFILPCHLAHTVRLAPTADNDRTPRRSVLSLLVERMYLPVLKWSLRNPAVIVSASVASMCLIVGLYQGGFTPLVTNQKLDYAFLYTFVEYPRGTPSATVTKATERLESSFRQLDSSTADGQSLVKLMYRSVGGTTRINNQRGELYAELDQSRVFDEASSQQLIQDWRQLAGDFPGAERVVFWGLNNAPGGKPIELSLLSGDINQLETVATAIKERLQGYDGLHDISDSRGPGKWELRMKLKPEAEALGVTLAELGRTARAAFYGKEAMRLQRGRHEVKVMVRYPHADRRRRAALDDIRVRTSSGTDVPLPALAQIEIERGYSQILRIDQRRAVTITADVDSTVAVASRIATDLEQQFLPPLLAANPAVQVRWEGQQRETRQSVTSLFIGFAVAVFGMYGLLTLMFRSYFQPLVILAVIPFGVVGAILGHLALEQPVTLFSLFGIVTLSGVVANDSIVLIDFINRQRDAGATLHDAILEAGSTRFRPVILTTLTTVAALLPILLENNTQAQVLIPMAVSIACGLILATVWVLLLAPVLYQAYATACHLLSPSDRSS